MPISITPTKTQDITKIVCPDCKERVRYIGLLKGSKIDGLAFKCSKFGKLCTVKSE